MYCRLPSALTLTEPCAGPVITWVVRLGPSTSLSLVRTSMRVDVLSGTVAVSLPATGASLTAAIVSVTVARFEVDVPSVTVYVNESVPK